MIYKDFNGKKISRLGFGAMRLPVFDKDDSKIDQEQVQQMVDYSMEHGVNYYDTAWGYHNYMSEVAMGKALKKHPRESFYLATKFPGYDLSNMPKVEEIFEKQLEKLQTDYFDFYLIHNVCELNIDAYLDPQYGILPYVVKQKENGRIRHLGFSAHGDLEVIKRFLEVYGSNMEFGQLQLNYLDWEFQKAKEKYNYLKAKNLPVIVMEPVRGGMLASLNEKYEKTLHELRPDEKTVAWAFRFLQSIDGVMTTLSGMSNFDQLKENIATYEEEKALNDREMEAILKIANEMVSKKIVPCTACRYCTSYCPRELDIPHLLKLYNEHKFTEGGFIAPMALGALPVDKQPSACMRCRSCESVCPQQIKISEAMVDFSSMISNTQPLT